MNPLYKDIIGSWVRAGLLLASTLLVQHHIVTASQSEQLTTMWFDQIINALPGLISLGWSSWEKFCARRKLVTALTMPAGATEAAVDQKIAIGVGVPSTKTSATVVPTALALLLLVGGAFTLPGCASSQALHLAVTADTAIVNALHQVKVDEAVAFQAGLYSKEKHVAYLKTILQADRDALALTDAVDTWRAAGANPKSLPVLVATAKSGLQVILNDMAPSPNNALTQSLRTALSLLS